MGARDQALIVEVVDDRLVISMGIDALMTAAQGADDWDEEQFRVSDPDAFAASIARGLDREEEDGTTPVHLAINGAVMWAIENAEPGVQQLIGGVWEE
jgi:hypothetical protein